MPDTMSMSAEDRAAIAALTAAINSSTVAAQQMSKSKEKGFFSKVADAIEEHPICTLSVVLVAAVAAESYIMYKTRSSND